jgi:hypothetical protein
MQSEGQVREVQLSPIEGLYWLLQPAYENDLAAEIIDADKATPGVISALEDVLAAAQKQAPKARARPCPTLSKCGTFKGECPELIDCGKFG